MDRELRIKSKQRLFLLAGLTCLLVLIFAIGCTMGPYALSLSEVIQTLRGNGTWQSDLVMFEYRLPRLSLAVLVGAGMGFSGVMMQCLLHNDLASPGTLGVADGSSLFVTFYIAVLAKKADQPVLLPILALAGGILSACVIFLLGTKRDRPISSIRLIMTGVAMGACYSAIGTFVMYILDETQLEFLQRWQSGELWGAQWDYILILTVWLAGFGLFAMLQARVLNVIAMGYDLAAGLGVQVKKSFVLLSFIAIAISSASVAFGGNFFFLGLIGPHIARRLAGPDTRYLLPTAGVVSAIIIVLANVLVENVAWLINIPTGILISVLSVPYFLYLLLHTR